MGGDTNVVNIFSRVETDIDDIYKEPETISLTPGLTTENSRMQVVATTGSKKVTNNIE